MRLRCSSFFFKLSLVSSSLIAFNVSAVFLSKRSFSLSSLVRFFGTKAVDFSFLPLSWCLDLDFSLLWSVFLMNAFRASSLSVSSISRSC